MHAPDIRRIIEDRIKSLNGDNFQDFCDRLCIKLFPNDYTTVRDGGIHGDDKNDGYCPKTKIFFQAHATVGETATKTKNKIATDLSGCLKKHPELKKWIYLTNNTPIGEVHTFVQGLRKKYSQTEIEIWDHKIISEKVSVFGHIDIESIIGISFTNDQITNSYQINELNLYSSVSNDKKEATIIDEIFDYVLEKSKNFIPDAKNDLINLDLNEKIKLNFKNSADQAEVIQYCKLALQKMSLISERISGLDTEKQGDIQSYMLSSYCNLKREFSNNIEILNRLFNIFIPKGKKQDPIYCNIAKAFVLFFFDDCTIFEKNKKNEIC